MEAHLLIIDGPPGSIGRSGILNHLTRLPKLQHILVDDVDREAEHSLMIDLEAHFNCEAQIFISEQFKSNGEPRKFAALDVHLGAPTMLEFDELLPPLLGQGNDWTLFQRAVELRFPARSKPAYTLPVSVVIRFTTAVRNWERQLQHSLIPVTPLSLIEIVIADDGSSDSPESLIPLFEDFFPIKHVSQEDLGYRLSEIRNLAFVKRATTASSSLT